MANAIFDVNRLNGLILTGGRSTRMGQDKSQLVYHRKPQREYLTDLLQAYCDVVYWSLNVEQATESTLKNQFVIVDAFDWPGPLNGILSAFQQHTESAWLVVACDMPLLGNRTLDALITGRDRTKMATVFYDSDGYLPEPLVGIYELAFGPILQQAVARGQYSPRQLLRQNTIQLLTVPDSRELLNINDPAAKEALGL